MCLSSFTAFPGVITVRKYNIREGFNKQCVVYPEKCVFQSKLWENLHPRQFPYRHHVVNAWKVKSLNFPIRIALHFLLNLIGIPVYIPWESTLQFISQRSHLILGCLLKSSLTNEDEQILVSFESIIECYYFPRVSDWNFRLSGLFDI